MLVVAPTPNGWGIVATQDIPAATCVLEDKPYIISPTNYVGILARFFSLSEDELKFLATLHANVTKLQDDSEIERILARDSKHWQGFKWFWCILKCNAHALKEGSGVVAIYRHAVRINHSCDPNVICSTINGIVRYTVVRDIKEGEELTCSYISDLFGSREYRQKRLLKDKLFLCRCSRCETSTHVDPQRTFICPSKQDPKSTLHYNDTHNEKEPWYCTDCQSTFPSTVLPLALEAVLQDSYHSLTNMDVNHPVEWLKKVAHLYQLCHASLPSNHWITIGCHRLMCKFYTGAYEALVAEDDRAEEKLSYLDLAMQHGFNFMLLASQSSPESLMTDVIPWAFKMMQLSLRARAIEHFRSLAVKFFLGCKIVYGPDNAWISLFETILEAQTSGGSESMKSTVLQNLSFPEEVKGGTVVIPTSQEKWLDPNLDDLQMLIGKAAMQTDFFQCRPWEDLSFK